ncbi:MAG: DUF4913 domain-containing protein [Actinoallomurus sp.]
MAAPTNDPSEAVAELTARLNGVTTDLERLGEVVEELTAHQTSPAERQDQAQPEDQQKQDQAEAPPHILTLTGEQARQALTRLAKWVDGYLVPSYIAGRTVSPANPWCPSWWLHPEAVARLEAVWLAFTELADPESGGYTGRGTWFREHLDIAVEQLRSPTGPFARCMTDSDYPKHAEPDDLQVGRYPPPGPELETTDPAPDAEPVAVD